MFKILFFMFICQVLLLCLAKITRKKDALVLSVTFCIGLLFIFISIMIKRFTGGKLNIAALETLKNDLFTSTTGLAAFAGSVVSVIIAILLIIFIGFITYKFLQRKQFCRFIPAWLGFFVMCLLLNSSPFMLDIRFAINYYQIIYQQVDPNSDFNRYFITPKLKGKKALKKNVVFLYLESYERTFFDKDTFGDITPNLKRLAKNNLTFTNISQINNVEFTIAGMVASQCGVPFVTPKLMSKPDPDLDAMAIRRGGIVVDNAFGKQTEQFLAQATCFTDVMKDAGYDLFFSKAASLDFSGAGNFYKTHGVISMRDSDTIGPKYNNPPQNDWGIYDDVLLDDFYKEFIERSKKRKPFMMMGITVDTHFYDGFIPDSCPKELIDEELDSMSNAIRCSDHVVNQFVNKIRKSPYGDNTIIILASDHLMMNNPLWDKLENSKRRNQFTIINPSRKAPRTITRPASTMDVGVTVLDELGLGIKRLGLGRSLLSKNITMVERYGVDGLNIKMESWLPNIIRLWSVEDELPPSEKKK